MMSAASTGADAVAALTVLLVYGITQIQKDYKEHEEKKLTAEMEAVNLIYTQTLTNLVVKGHAGDIKLTIPPIFIFDESKPDVPVKSLVLNAKIIKSLSDIYPTPEPSLQSYGEHIHNAMLALRKFDYMRQKDRDRFRKGKPDDLTASVIAYLVLFLSTHCYKIDGPDIAICYLDALSNFVYRFGSSSKHHQNSDRYDHMSKVYKELTAARALLFQFSLSLSYTTILTTLIPEVTAHTNELFKVTVKLMTPEPVKHWPLIEFLTVQNILDGIIKEEFTHAHEGLFGGKAIEILDCPIKAELQVCAKDYFTAIRTNDDPDNKAAFITNKKHSLDFTKDEYEHLKKVFYECENFMTQKVRPGEHMSLDVWLRDYRNEINQRAQAYFDITSLINKLVVAMYFCKSLFNRVKQLGEIYISNPHHCVYIFEIFNGMTSMIDDHTKTLIATISKIAADNGDRMPLVPQQSAFESLSRILDNIRTQTIPYMKDLYRKHTEHPQNKSVDYDKEITDNVNSMVYIARVVASRFDISTPTSNRIKYRQSPSSAILDIPSSLSNRSDSDSKGEVPHPNTPVPPDHAGGPLTPLHAEEKKPEPEEDGENILKNIHVLIENIRSVDSRQAREYAKIYHSIHELRLKAIKLELDDGISRREKGKNLEKLITDICKPFEDFLKEERDQRIKDAEFFMKKIRGYVNSPDSFFMDKHRRFIKIGNREITFGNTDSRSLANKVLENCEHLAKESKRFS